MGKVYVDKEDFRTNYPECFNNDSLQGGQSMDQIKDLELYNLSQQMFNLWESRGPRAATTWASGNMTPEQMVAARPYMKMIFEKNGYSLGD